MNTAMRSSGGWRRRLAITATLTAVAGLVLSGCAGSSGGEADDAATEEGDFVIHASLGLSGTSATFATALGAGIEAAASTINENGGILGREVVVEIENNESTPTTAVSNLQRRLREGEEPDVIWAGSTSSETLALLSLATREEIISLNNASAPEVGDAATFPYSFSAGIGIESQADFVLEQLQAAGHKTVGVLTAAGAFGEAQATQYTKTFEAAGLTVVAETYEPDAVEMDGPLARINEKNPDAVVFNDFVHPTYILQSRIKVGMGDVPFYGDLSTTINDMSETVSDVEAEGVQLTTYRVQTNQADRPGVQDLIDQLEKNGTEITTGLYLYALAYDTVLAYADAAEAIGTTDVDKVAAAMVTQEGDLYRLAITDDIGWTEEVHIGAGQSGDLFTLIPVSPMIAGQFQID